MQYLNTATHTPRTWKEYNLEDVHLSMALPILTCTPFMASNKDILFIGVLVSPSLCLCLLAGSNTPLDLLYKIISVLNNQELEVLLSTYRGTSFT